MDDSVPTSFLVLIAGLVAIAGIFVFVQPLAQKAVDKILMYFMRNDAREAGVTPEEYLRQIRSSGTES